MPEPKKPVMRKLDITDYVFKLPAPITQNGEEITEVNFEVKRSLREVLFNSAQQLTVDEAFRNKDLVDRIESANGSLLVNDAEFDSLMRAYNTARAPREHELEFYKRIRDAEIVEVEEKSNGN